MANGLQVTEKTKVRCAETAARWDALVDRARGLPTPEQREGFLDTAGGMGLLSAMVLVQAACADPEGAQRITSTPLATLLDDVNTDLALLEKGVETAAKLDVPVRSATVAAGEHARDSISAAEAARSTAETTRVLLPVVLGIAGSILTTLLGSALSGR